MSTNKNLLSFFWDLASTNEDIRIDAAVNLIKHLETTQATNNNVEKQPSDDLTYSLKRLVKGLASSRKAARQGFAMALTELVSLFDQVTIDKVMEYMNECLVVTKSCSSQEERDAYFGQIFGLASLGRVICIAKQHNKDHILKSSLKKVVEVLKEVSTKKSYLQEICFKAIVDILSMLSFKEFEEHILPVLENDIKCHWEQCSPNILIIILSVWRLFKDKLGGNYFKKSWKSSQLDSPGNYPCLAKILQNSFNAHHNLHYVWMEVFLVILNSQKTDFKSFWTTVVDDNLFHTSHERKFLGFKVLEKVLPSLSVDQIKYVFSPQLMHCIFNTMSHNTNYLYASTKQMLEGIGKNLATQDKQSLVIPVIKELVGRNGNVCFDAVTKTKTIDNLIPKMVPEDLPEFISWLKECFEKGTTKDGKSEDDKNNIEKTREGILGLFLSLIRCKQLAHGSSWVLSAVYFIFETAYFKHTGPVLHALSRRTRLLCQQRFNSILGELATICDRVTTDNTEKQNAEKEGRKLEPKTLGLADDGCLWVSHIMQHAKTLLKSSDFQIVKESWTEEVQKLFTKTMKIVKKLEQEDVELKLENRAFILMFLYTGVQLFSETEQATEIIEELFQCYEKVKSQKSTKMDEEELPWMDVITEILVSFLTDSSNLRRQVVNQVFNIIVPHLTSSALTIILEAIDPRNSLNEDSTLQVETFSESEEDDMEEVDSEDGDENEGDASGEEESDSDEDMNEEDDDEEQGSIDPLFKVDLQAALGDALVNEEDSDAESNSDDDMDDEAMMKLDGALSEVFKQHLKTKHAKKKAKDAKQSVLHFKLRVLDLVEIFIKQQPCNDLILELIQPLLNIIRTCLNSKDFVTLGEKAQSIFKNKLCTIKQRPKLTPAYVENAHKNIEMLLKEAMKGPSVAVVTMMSTGCLFLIRQIHRGVPVASEDQINDSGINEPINEFALLDFSRLRNAYCEALKDFMLNRNTHLHTLLFQELINRYPIAGWYLSEDLVQYITQGINNYRKIQACTLLLQLFSKKIIPCYFEHIKKLITSLQNAFHLSFTCTDVELKAKHLRQILKLASRFVKVLKSGTNGDDKWLAMLDTHSLLSDLNVVADSRTVERANDLKNVIQCLKSSIAGETSNGDDDKKSIKRKREKSTINESPTTIKENEEPVKTETKKENKVKRKKKEKKRDE